MKHNIEKYRIFLKKSLKNHFSRKKLRYLLYPRIAEAYTRCFAPVKISDSYDKQFWLNHSAKITPKNARFSKPGARGMVCEKKN